jgi:hypothetical protein
MIADDRFDAEVRRGITAIGDAAGVAPSLDDIAALELSRGRRRTARRTLLPALAGALIVVAIATAIVWGQAGGGTRVVPATPSSTSPPVTAVTFGGLGSPLADVVAPVLPPGFRLVFTNVNPLHAVAYDEAGTRIDVRVNVGQDASSIIAGGVWFPTPQGHRSGDGATILTDASDLIATTASFGDGQSITQSVASVQPLLAPITDAVTAAMLDDRRAALLQQVQPDWVGATGLTDAVSAAITGRLPAPALGDGGTGTSVGEVGWFVFFGDDVSNHSSVHVAAFHTQAQLADGTLNTAEGNTVVTRWVNGWQVIVTTSGAQAPHIPAELDLFVAAVVEVFAAWVPAPPPTSPPPPSTSPALAVRPAVAFGESVMLSAKNQMGERGITVFAEEAEQGKVLLETIRTARAEGLLGKTVIVQTGTNGTVEQSVYDAIMAELPPDQSNNVIFLTVHANRSWIAGNNERIRALPGKYPNVQVVDWDAMANANPGYLTSDGIHLKSDEAIIAYTDAIVAAYT